MRSRTKYKGSGPQNIPLSPLVKTHFYSLLVPYVCGVEQNCETNIKPSLLFQPRYVHHGVTTALPSLYRTLDTV